MAIIFSRCYALLKEKKISFMPNHGQQMQIGLVVAKKYKEQNNGRAATKVKAPDYVGNFSVSYYPAAFTPEIDKVIIQFASGAKFKNSAKTKQHA